MSTGTSHGKGFRHKKRRSWSARPLVYRKVPCLFCISVGVQVFRHCSNNCTYWRITSARILANVDKEWLADVRRAPHLLFDGTFERNDPVSPFLQAAMIHWVHQFYLFLKKNGFFFPLSIVWLIRCVAMMSELGIITKAGKYLTGSRGALHISAADGLYGLKEGWPDPRLVNVPVWHGWPYVLVFRHARSNLYVHGISWHESGEAVGIFGVHASWRKGSEGRTELHALKPYFILRCR